jgi:hypothetical protein
LKTAEEYFEDLESRFLRHGILDTKKIGRLLKLGEMEPIEFDGIVDFSDFIEVEKFKVFKKQHQIKLNETGKRLRKRFGNKLKDKKRIKFLK